MSTHRPGPWKIVGPIRDGRDISIEASRASGNPQYIGRVYNAGIFAKSDPESEANARLIAAAPALLESLEHLAKIVTHLSSDEILLIHNMLPSVNVDEQIDQANAAIRAAKGKD